MRTSRVLRKPLVHKPKPGKTRTKPNTKTIYMSIGDGVANATLNKSSDGANQKLYLT